jgi:serine/threonine protein kinase
VLCHLATRLKMLHEQGWVHRDLKPGNVLRLPKQHSWTLIDFGCVAQIGASWPLFAPWYP